MAVGSFVVDMLVGGVVLVENKAVGVLARGHEMQLVNYLTATGIDIGLILNFGSERLEFKRKSRTRTSGRAGETARQDGQDETG